MMQVILERAEALHADEQAAAMAHTTYLAQPKHDVLAVLRAQRPEEFSQKAPFNEALKRAKKMRTRKDKPEHE